MVIIYSPSSSQGRLSPIIKVRKNKSLFNARQSMIDVKVKLKHLKVGRKHTVFRSTHLVRVVLSFLIRLTIVM